jgi:hypothetical protein
MTKLAKRMTGPSEEELIDRALMAYVRRGCNVQPASALSRVEGDEVILENCNGELARYWYDRAKDRLHYLPFGGPDLIE